MLFCLEPRCEDILECQQLCINLECVCLHGYILALDKKNCIGIIVAINTVLVINRIVAS